MIVQVFVMPNDLKIEVETNDVLQLMFRLGACALNLMIQDLPPACTGDKEIAIVI